MKQPRLRRARRNLRRMSLGPTMANRVRISRTNSHAGDDAVGGLRARRKRSTAEADRIVTASVAEGTPAGAPQHRSRRIEVRRPGAARPPQRRRTTAGERTDRTKPALPGPPGTRQGHTRSQRSAAGKRPQHLKQETASRGSTSSNRWSIAASRMSLTQSRRTLPAASIGLSSSARWPTRGVASRYRPLMFCSAKASIPNFPVSGPLGQRRTRPLFTLKS